MPPTTTATRLLMTRTTFAIRAFFLSFFSLFTVALGIVLIWIPEVKETLEAFDTGSWAQIGYFAVAQLYWAVCAWYCARLVLERRCLPFEPLLPCASPRFAGALVTWVPRIVGVLATVPMAIVTLRAPKGSLSPSLRVTPIVVGAFFLTAVVFRRRLFGEFVDYAPDPPDVDYGYNRFGGLNPRGRKLLVLLALVPVLIFLVLRVDARLVARALSTPALVLFAIGSWNLSTGFLLIYLPLSRHWAVWTLYPLLFAAVFSIWVENHNTPSGPPAPIAAARMDGRPSLEAQWQQWKAELDRTECRNGPIYLVAAAGGASRAAYWAADVLTRTEQQLRKEVPAGHDACFLRNVFAISGISGGSLGAATVVSLMADEQVRGARWSSLPDTAATFLEKDMLAPVAGYLLFPDLVQRFWPWPVYWADRSRGLEQTWQHDWADIERTWTGPAQQTPENWFEGTFERLYAKGRAATLPSLFLNSTRVADGRRVLQSNIAFAPDDTYDLLSNGFLTNDLTLAGAIHNSARFLYVSPAGLAWHATQSETHAVEAAPWGYLVDGGYFENSGAATLVPVLQQIQTFMSASEHWKLTLILVSNAPSDGRSDYVCDPNPAAPKVDPVSSFLIEATAPPLALYETRNARAHAADMSASRVLDGYVFDHMFELRLPKEKDKNDESGKKDVPPPPMTWFVSKRVGDQMTSYVEHPRDHGATRLADNLEALRARTTSPCAALNDRSTAK